MCYSWWVPPAHSAPGRLYAPARLGGTERERTRLMQAAGTFIVCLFVCLFTHSFTHSLTHSLIYSFVRSVRGRWVLSSLAILERLDWIDQRALEAWILQCQARKNARVPTMRVVAGCAVRRCRKCSGARAHDVPFRFS